VVTAARVARIFGMDPVAVLDADPFEFEVRVAAARAAVRDMESEEVGRGG
jgi:hypothetical protein